MKTENEIISSSLVERQKLFVEMKAVSTRDKDFANAKAIIEVIEATDDWEAPELEDAIATNNTIIDGKTVSKGESVKVYSWQFDALRRHFADPKELETKKKKSAPSSVVAALIAAFLFAFTFAATAQNQTYVVGGPGTYNVVSVAGLYGGTNNVVGTNTTYGVAQITTNTVVVPNWTFSNGIWTNTPTTNTISVTTNTPGVVSLVNLDMCNVVFGAALTGAGTSTAIASFDTSDDLITFQTNKYQCPILMAGTSFVSTNLGLTLVPFGYLRLNNISYPSPTTGLTNIVLTLSKKPGRTGP
jgi:hypothetical protein